MRKTNPVGIRLAPEIKEALEIAAKQDARTLSSLISKILAEWVKAKEQAQ